MTNNKLTKMQNHILNEKGTEMPFTGVLNDNKKPGTYICAQCGAELFSSDAKFDSGSGWPSFYDVLDQAKVDQTEDNSGGMSRTEVTCQNCGGHLGHVFNDGPSDKTGLRFCINSAALNFMPEDGDDVVRGDS